MFKILPSVLALDFKDSKKYLDLIKENAEIIHFDVMDGHFVSNISFGPSIMSDFKKATGCLMDVHIMVTNPERVLEYFSNDKPDILTFHYETLNNSDEIIDLVNKIKEKGIKAGISIKPDTDVRVLDEMLKIFDLILIMSVEPGRGGQAFIEDSISKIEYLARKKKENNYNYIIEVDGGINDKTIAKVINAGAEYIVVGSYLFKDDFTDRYQKLLQMN